MSNEIKGNESFHSRGLLKSTGLQVLSAVVATSIIAALGIDKLPAILPWSEESSVSTIIDATTSTLAFPGSTLQEETTSTSEVISPTTTAKIPSPVKLASASFTNELLTIAMREGRPTWSTLPLSHEALKDSTQHDNAAKTSVSTSTTPETCKWENQTLFFMSSGVCILKIKIPQATKNAKYKSFETSYKITVNPAAISSPSTYSPIERVSTVATARGNFLMYGREVPTELTHGDALGYWHMKMTVSLKQPDPALGSIDCYRVYARYQYGSNQSFNDFTGDVVSCKELSGTTQPKEFCVNFQPAWYQILGSTKVPIGFTNQDGFPLQDLYSKVKYSRIGWGIEWNWVTYKATQMTAGANLTSEQKNMVESPSHRPEVEVHEIAAGKCS